MYTLDKTEVEFRKKYSSISDSKRFENWRNFKKQNLEIILINTLAKDIVDYFYNSLPAWFFINIGGDFRPLKTSSKRFENKEIGKSNLGNHILINTLANDIVD